MATSKNDYKLSKNKFLQTTYDRKVRIRYDRLEKVLKDNINILSSINAFVEHIFGVIVSLIGTIVTITTAKFSDKCEWIRYVCISVCVVASIYYIVFFVYFIINRKTTEDIIYLVEKDNELDEKNHVKKKNR